MVSIAMATYNGAKYLREQLDSICAQTINDYELIVCDDCSTDDTYAILKEYALKDARIRVYKNEVNLGFKKNFEKAISLCKGEYIALSDQDDIWYNNHLEILLNNIGDNILACADEELVDYSGHSLGMTVGKQLRLTRIPSASIAFAKTYFCYRSAFMGACMLMKKKIVKYALPIPSEIKYHDSWFFILSCFCGGVVYINYPISKFRQHGDNASGNRVRRWTNPIFTFWKRLFSYPESLHDREMIAEMLIERVNPLMKRDKVFLSEMLQYHRQKDSFWGRIKNVMYDLSHFRVIFTC